MSLLQGKAKMRLKLTTERESEDGFGFTIKGGRDKCLPITIETVADGSLTFFKLSFGPIAWFLDY